MGERKKHSRYGKIGFNFPTEVQDFHNHTRFALQQYSPLGKKEQGQDAVKVNKCEGRGKHRGRGENAGNVPNP